MSGQRGQAIVGVLVVMTLVFLLAGAVSIGASAVLAREAKPRDGVTDDLFVQSAVSASASHVAAQGASSCPTLNPPGSGAAGGTGGAVNAPPPFTITLPPTPGTADPALKDRAYCAGVGRAAGAPDRLNLSWPSGDCSVTPLPGGQSAVWVLMGTRSWSSKSFAYVAESPQQPCPTVLPTDPSVKCSAVTGANPKSAGPMAFIAMFCDLSAARQPTFLYVVNNHVRSPQHAYLGASDPHSSTTCYLVESGTHLAPPNDTEEALILVPGSQRAQVRYEEALP